MAVRPIDADELLAFPYSESAGTDEQIENWIEECGLSDEEVIDRAKKLCWTVIDGFINVVKTEPALTPPNEPLTQADLDAMDYDKVWLDYGGDGEWALVVSGRIYALAVLEGAGFEDILRDEVDGETMDRPSGNYTVYRRPPEGEEDT